MIGEQTTGPQAGPAREAPRAAAELRPGEVLNMELSVLAFNRRVLALAEDPNVPLLERVRFMSIFGSNLDEFFRVRVAGYKRQVALRSSKPTLDGASPADQLRAIERRTRKLLDSAYRLLFERLFPELARHEIRVLRLNDLRERDRAYLWEYYRDRVHAALTPLAVDPQAPLPHVRNGRPALLVITRDSGVRHSVIELPGALPRLVPVPGPGHRFVPLKDVIRAHLHEVYPGLQVVQSHAFRVTRSAELHLHDDEPVADMMELVERQVRERPFRPVMRLDLERGTPPAVRDFVLRGLRREPHADQTPLGPEDIFEVPWPLDLRSVREIANLPISPLHWPERSEIAAAELPQPVWDALRQREVLVGFPEDSFQGTVERFLLEAAEDPQVIAIKLALYRTNPKSHIVDALRRASRAGKHVVALVELTARFDEERNIRWARYLKRAGIHVVFGRLGRKVHAKAALVVRQEEEGVRRYLYIGTGNLNAETASAYTDLGLLSADPALCDELSDVFNVLTGYSGEPEFRNLLVAPFNMRERFVELIERESEHARAGRGGWIRGKFNGLADRDMIAALYRASQAGVRIELLVRGLCSLRPGVAGLSENIRVWSILGRYLEHARIWRFANAGNPEFFIGSADWRTRNLTRRVEVVTPIRDAGHQRRLEQILEGDLARPDRWELGSDGSYYRHPDVAPHTANGPFATRR